jgi:hypothetical protein
MNKIKFSHNYPKLCTQKTAELLAVKTLSLPQDMNFLLWEYDTKYFKKYPINTVDYYQLGTGEHLQLIFLGNLGIPFCTIRPRYGKLGDKKDYCDSKIGELFEIVIEELEDAK